MQILVLDDSPQVAETMAQNVEGALSEPAEVTPLSGDDLKDVIRVLREREGHWQQNPAWSPHTYDEVFDTADVLIVDYRLADLYPTDAYLTGEDVAALARRYSHVGAIVSVNRLGGRRFDLRLRAQPESWADLSIAHEDLANPLLWSASPNGSYRPWNWPCLTNLPALMRQRVEFALARENTPVGRALRFPDELLRLVPNDIMEAIRADPTEATFADIALAVAFRSPKIPRPSRRQLSRIGAVEMGRWLSGHLLPGQDTLIDAPHLALLYPSLLGDPLSRDRLNQLCVLDPTADLPLTAEPIEGCRFQPAFWLDRPAWWTECLLENAELLENRQPWDKVEVGCPFAEDTSWFHTAEEVTPFEASGAFSRRFVLRPDDGVAYEPARRLLTRSEG